MFYIDILYVRCNELNSETHFTILLWLRVRDDVPFSEAEDEDVDKLGVLSNIDASLEFRVDVEVFESDAGSESA